MVNRIQQGSQSRKSEPASDWTGLDRTGIVTSFAKRGSSLGNMDQGHPTIEF